MKQWYAKELSKLVNVSVRTLHHYDKIGLLKPSVRQSNNYRLYSETDLLRLQQIIALKFFGFELSQIKSLLTNQDNALENLAMQSKLLQAKANALLEASEMLMRITNNCNNLKSIAWEQIIQLIEVYHMTQKLEHSWVKEIFNSEELKQYAEFEAEMKSRATPGAKEKFEKNWFNLIEDIKRNLDHDPKSQVGIALGRRCMELVNSLYGKKYAHLRNKKFEQGFGEGKGLEESGLTSEIVSWLEQSLDAYWRERIYSLLAHVTKCNAADLLQQWNGLMDEMYGEDQARKTALLKVALQDENVSQEARDWLKTTFRLI